ncbi:hypothetical protein ACIA3K_18290 [Micromonospora sp. NPDC051543]|uniref:hypothetical protein n=1 Tax=Micromonospora sp. NPDC051543 TaxID=3364287 RepID=UPI0037A37280
MSVLVLLAIGALSVLALVAALGYGSLGWSFVAVMAVLAAVMVVQVWRKGRSGVPLPHDGGRQYLLLGGLVTALWLVGVVLYLTYDLPVPRYALALLLVPCVSLLTAGLLQRRS